MTDEPDDEGGHRKARRRKDSPQPPPPPTDDTDAPLDDVPEDTPIFPLGYDRGTFFYYSRASQQVHVLTAQQHAAKANLLAMASLPWWAQRYPHGNGGVYWDMAISEMMDRCRRAGVYNPGRMRGRGAWTDEDRWVLHLGDRLLVDGIETPLGALDSWYLYEAGPAIRTPKRAPLSAGEASQVLGIAKRFRWEHPVSAFLLSGFCVTAQICGALRWRSHVWVTGGAGTGKTSVAQRFIWPQLRHCGLYVQGASTEAGLRQRLRSDALPVLFDEAESSDEAAQGRVMQILEMMRSSSSESGAEILKGAPNGQAVSYAIRSSFGLVSINPGVKAAADASRISFLTLKPAPSDTEIQRQSAKAHWESLSQDMGALLTETFCERLFARIIHMIPVIRRNAEVFATAVALHLGQQRIGDQLGHLLAGALALTMDDEITPDAARRWVSKHDWGSFYDQAETRDEELCLRHLLQSLLKVEVDHATPVDRSVAELCVIAAADVEDPKIGPDRARMVLRRHGLRVDGRTLFVANSHIGLARIFAHTAWSAQWGRQLQRLRFASVPATGVNFLPYEGAVYHGKPFKARAVALLLEEALSHV